MAKKSNSIKICLILLVIILLITAFHQVSVLSIYNRKNPSEKYYIKSDSLDRFEISYTHSVNKGRVYDEYLNYDPNTGRSISGFVLNKTRFVSYGAGIPEPEETPGAVFSVTNEGYVISKLNRYVPKLTMAVGLIANHEITFWVYKGIDPEPGHTYKLKDLFEPQTSIIFVKKRVTFFEYIIHKL